MRYSMQGCIRGNSDAEAEAEAEAEACLRSRRTLMRRAAAAELRPVPMRPPVLRSSTPPPRDGILFTGVF